LKDRVSEGRQTLQLHQEMAAASTYQTQCLH